MTGELAATMGGAIAATGSASAGEVGSWSNAVHFLQYYTSLEVVT